MAAENIAWRHSLAEAQQEAREQSKLVLIDLFNPGWGGCKAMGAGTYPQPEVEQYIKDNFIPVQFNVVEQPESMEQFNTPWTPTIIVQDAEGREHRRSQGYLDAPRFMAEVALARLKDAIDRRDFQVAQQRVEQTLALTKGDASREPEALYWAGVAAYKASDDPNNLVQGWNRLMDEFPQSEWAKRVEFIRQ